MLMRRRRGRTNSFYRFQIGTVPGNRNMCAAIGKVIEGELGTAALEQALRDEDAEPHMVGYPGAGRKIRFAEAPQQVEGKPRSVVVDLDRDRRRIPESGDADLAGGELNRVLDEVVEP